MKIYMILYLVSKAEPEDKLLSDEWSIKPESQVILCIVWLHHLLKGWKGHDSPINLSDVRLIRPALL
jgi:hypothetical protein